MSCRQAGRQADRQADSKITNLLICHLYHSTLSRGGGGIFLNQKPTIVYIFIKIIKFQTITHLIVCKMGEKKILGRLACLLVLDCVTLFRRDGGVLLTFSYIKKCHFGGEPEFILHPVLLFKSLNYCFQKFLTLKQTKQNMKHFNFSNNNVIFFGE